MRSSVNKKIFNSIKALRQMSEGFSLTVKNFFAKIPFGDDFMGEIEVGEYIIEWDDNKAE